MYKLLFVISFIFSLSLTTLGTTMSELTKCPDKPNCVITVPGYAKEGRVLSPISITTNKKEAHERMTKLLKKLEANIVDSNENYIKAEFTSSLFSFVDDVVFIFGDSEINFKSSSRKGYYDLGANKNRMEDIRFKFQQNDVL